jgi:periplasmic glucans biosynthesis protein
MSTAGLDAPHSRAILGAKLAPLKTGISMRQRFFLTGWLVLAIFGQGHGQDALPPVRTFLDLEAYASQLAQKAYVAPSEKLDPFFEGLKYEDLHEITFKKEKALYSDLGDTFHVEFFHPGRTFKRTVGFSEIVDGQPKPVPFAVEDFDYGKLKLPEKVEYPAGFSGFRLLAPDSLTGKRFDFLVFQGASYFRAVTTKWGWGLSARGVAINTVGGDPEEFPDFTHFWFMRPKVGDKTFKFYALLDGPSVTGAFEFEALPGEETIITVSSSLFLRKVVKLLGIAPFSSMFWYGENTQPKPMDFRPEVHDSDGLLIEQKFGPTIWRPLDNGKELRQSVFGIESLKGFGLLERDRDFSHFQDLEARYDKRSSVWVEPMEGFGRGELHLIELPTGEETWDNVVSLWEPDHLPTSVEPLRFAYKLHWLGAHDDELAEVMATRYGASKDAPNACLFVIDFSKGKMPDGVPPDWTPDMDVTIPAGAKLLDKRVMPNPETGGWRAFFKMDAPPSLKLLEMTCDLSYNKQPFSERWTYQWTR